MQVKTNKHSTLLEEWPYFGFPAGWTGVGLVHDHSNYYYWLKSRRGNEFQRTVINCHRSPTILLTE